ncbi:uncharacterized protein MCYG_07903 [Microsporum canis CBS 113480]|uniref:Uncharacterized protein n=1 Tax=Arthroderma otae (strain ATCC MYA-4605 / CBS 113480) TaxID=554155 RepID=C5FXP4_ARTOC|nr:uncharacterized protein MCYG_07903 [Microsporum canis CBS 113480]EEQ35084.1 predicted protein [Microsporum canis CBS 113480]
MQGKHGNGIRSPPASHKNPSIAHCNTQGRRTAGGKSQLYKPSAHPLLPKALRPRNGFNIYDGVSMKTHGLICAAISGLYMSSGVYGANLRRVEGWDERCGRACTPVSTDCDPPTWGCWQTADAFINSMISGNFGHFEYFRAFRAFQASRASRASQEFQAFRAWYEQETYRSRYMGATWPSSSSV